MGPDFVKELDNCFGPCESDLTNSHSTRREEISGLAFQCIQRMEPEEFVEDSSCFRVQGGGGGRRSDAFVEVLHDEVL